MQHKKTYHNDSITINILEFMISYQRQSHNDQIIAEVLQNLLQLSLFLHFWRRHSK